MESHTEPLYILDSYGLIYRSYFAFVSRPLINKNGENISAVFGFFRNLKSLLDTYQAKYIAAAFDSRTQTFRHKQYPEYKATRQKTPEDLHMQVPVVEKILTSLGIPVLRQDGFEADDIIATLASQCTQQHRECRILSGDKDLMQLVNDTTKILRPSKTGGWQLLDSHDVTEEWGIIPSQMIDFLSLTGDTADNIPGVAGIGKKTAVKLLSEYGSLDTIYEHAEEIKGATGNKIREGKDSAYFSRSLIKLCTNVAIQTHIAPFIEQADFAKAAELLYAHGLPSIAKMFESGTPITTTQSEKKTIINTHNPTEIDSNTDISLRKNTGDYKAVTSLTELNTYLNAVLAEQDPEIAFDCETNSLHSLTAEIIGFSLSNTSGSGIYIPIIQPDPLLSKDTISKQAAFKELERIFLNKDNTVIMHNGKFDYEVLMANGLPRPLCHIADTMVAAWLIEPDRASFGLEQLSAAKLGLETISYDTVVPKGKTFADVPLEQAVSYAAEDADLTWQLWQQYKNSLKEQGLWNLFTNLEMPILPILAHMEQTGIHIEEKELYTYGEELRQQLINLEEEIYQLVGHPFNIASPKQLQEVLFSELGLIPDKKTKTGYSTDTAVLEKLKSQHPIPAKILEYRMRAKLLSTYVDTLPKLTDLQGRIHTSFIQTGTATGRLSSREPNLQNIPIREEEGRRIRQAFSAENGKMLISADYSQIELVILAHLSHDTALCEAFRQGTDVHRSTASLIFGVSPELVQPEMRRTAKIINFGVMYGMSAFRLSNELGIPRAKADAFIKQYFSTYSGIRTFIDDTVRIAEEKGYVETILGRRRYIRAINSKNKLEKAGAERIAVNTPIQGSAADIVKKAMIAVNFMLQEQYPQAQLLLQVHDELIIECPEEQTQEIACQVKKCMEHIVELAVPLKVSVEYGKRWGDFH